MPDATYQPNVYKKQGGNELVVASGGALTLESGALVTTAGGIGTANATANVTAVEHGITDVIHKTVLTLTATPVSVVGAAGVGFGGVKCYDFPEGVILVLGSVVELAVDWSASSIAAAGSGDAGLGTAIVSDSDLGDATDVDLGPSTALTDPFVAGIGDVDVVLAANAQFDGTATAKDANLNVLVDDADIAGTEEVLFTGTWTLTWINLGNVTA